MSFVVYDSQPVEKIEEIVTRVLSECFDFNLELSKNIKELSD
jgi:hypothetical protein